jgi:uncharacterized caspase-like protein
LDNEEEKEKRKAIIIGINRYEADPIIPTLKGAENDAKEIHDILIKYGNFQVHDNHFLLGHNATRRNILKAVNDLFRKDNKYHLVAFYFSGHGVIDETNDEGYLAPYDMDPEASFISGINMEELKKVINNTKNITNTIIILDCCYPS